MWRFLVAFVLCVDEKGDLIVAPLKMPLLLGERRLRFNLWRLRQPWVELRWPQTLRAPCPQRRGWRLPAALKSHLGFFSRAGG